MLHFLAQGSLKLGPFLFRASKLNLLGSKPGCVDDIFRLREIRNDELRLRQEEVVGAAYSWSVRLSAEKSFGSGLRVGCSSPSFHLSPKRPSVLLCSHVTSFPSGPGCPTTTPACTTLLDFPLSSSLTATPTCPPQNTTTQPLHFTRALYRQAIR